jgi:thiol:disulfide interchange protein
MKKLAMVFALVAVFAAGAHAEVTFKSLSFAEALKLAKKEKKIIMVDYYTTWCGWCKVLDKKTYSNKEVGEYADANMVSLKIDAERGEGIDLTRRSDIKGFPTIIFYDADGKELHRVVGFVDAAPFMQRMKMAMAASQSSESKAAVE